MRINLLMLVGNAATLACLSSPIQLAAAQFVDLTGEIEVTEWNSKGVRTWPTLVHCVVGTNSWQMDGDFSRNATVTLWFTGTNLVEHSVVTKNLSQEFLKLASRPGFPAIGSPAIGSQSSRAVDSLDGNPGRPVRQADQLTTAACIAWP